MKKTILLLSLVVCLFLSAEEGRSQGKDLYDPPPPSMGQSDQGGGAVSGKKQYPGGVTKPGAPRGRGRGSGGNAPKRSRILKTSELDEASRYTWDVWWARNRYQFLDFPDADRDEGSTNRKRGSGKSALSQSFVKDSLRTKGIAVLRLYLESDQKPIKRAALIGLGRLKDEKSLPGMTKALKDRDTDVSRAAVIALGLFGSGRTVYTLLNLARGTEQGCILVDRTPVPKDIRTAAAVMLALSGAKGAGPTLKSIALDDSCADELRSTAIEGLGLVGDKDSLRFLMDFCGTHRRDNKLLSSALIGLGRIDDSEATNLLMKHLNSGATEVRRSAALAMSCAARKSDETAVRNLFQCYKQTNDRIMKGLALIALGQVGGGDAVEKLKSVMVRGTTSDLDWAALGLGVSLSRMQDASVPELLTAAFDHHESSVRNAAAVALGLAGNLESVERLVEIVNESDDPSLRGYCAVALGMIGERFVIPDLRNAIAEENPPVTIQAALALCLLDDRDSTPQMLDILFSSNCEASQAMISRSIVHLKDTRSPEELFRFVTTRRSNEITYMHCLDALSKLIAGQSTFELDRMAKGSDFINESPVMADLLDSGI